MNLLFHPTQPSDALRLRAFLQKIFRVGNDAPFLDPALIEWKYYRTHPFWEGSRSFVYETGADLAAHVCAWPWQVLTTGGPLMVVHPIDWAASSEVPGAGALLLREIRGLRDISLCVGGTPSARKVIARTGFHHYTDLDLWVRPLRPLRQTLTHQNKNWKLPARWARNLIWTLRSTPSVPAGWTSEPIDPRDLPDAVLPQPLPGTAVTGRSRPLFEYFALCPVARHQLFLVRSSGAPVGYFLLSFTPGQARICDAYITEWTVSTWAGLYASAIRTALDEGSTAEIVAASSHPVPRDALGVSAFRRYNTLPITCFDPQQRLAPADSIHMQMIDGDLSFLHENRP
ncbi:MAG TPA: hypothetical protein VMT89_19145, partial [Candidatus Acidoferrales bacterium]|nr:hypothetical protein [Candidatus Acidoferrales bacterium]